MLEYAKQHIEHNLCSLITTVTFRQNWVVITATNWSTRLTGIWHWQDQCSSLDLNVARMYKKSVRAHPVNSIRRWSVLNEIWPYVPMTVVLKIQKSLFGIAMQQPIQNHIKCSIAVKEIRHRTRDAELSQHSTWPPCPRRRIHPSWTRESRLSYPLILMGMSVKVRACQINVVISGFRAYKALPLMCRIQLQMFFSSTQMEEFFW